MQRDRVEMPGLGLEPLDLERPTAKLDLAVNLIEAAGELTGAWMFNTDLYDGTTMRRLAGQWAVLLAGAVEAPERRLSELPLLSAAERHQLRGEWNDTPAPYRGALRPPGLSVQPPAL